MTTEVYLKFIGFIIAFALIAYQLNKQHKSNQRLQKEKLQEQLKLEIFNKISERIKFSEDNYTKLYSKLNIIVLNCESNQSLQENGIEPIYISDRTHQFHKAHFDFAKSLIELIFISEKYFIVGEIFKIFSMAFQAVSYDLNKDFKQLNDILIPLLPFDRVSKDNEKQTVIPQKISKNTIVKLKKHSELYQNTLFESHSYIYDLKTEIQNLLLGEIFENKINPRKELNNTYIVISSESTKSIKQLEEYFLNKTEWGNLWKETKTKYQGQA